MMKYCRVDLNPARIQDKESMHEYMQEIFMFPEGFGFSLDALRDALSEVTDDYDLMLDENDLAILSDSPYAYRTLVVLSDASRENPHIRIKLKKSGSQ